MLVLRQDIEELIERMRAFYTLKKKGAALVQVKEIKSIEISAAKPLNQWKFPQDLYEYLDMSIERLILYWNKRHGINDDLIPAIYPWFGIAEHSAFVGGNVDFSNDTSWHHPIIQNWDELDNLELREDNFWIRMIIDGLQYLKERSMGRYAVKLRGGYSPLDLAMTLRGNNIFMDLYDEPEQVHRLLDFCTSAVKWYMDHQKAIVGDFCDGVITGMDIWFPGNSMGHLSEDASALCSPGNYREFGMPYTAKLVKHYEHAFMHTHSLGIHNIPEVASIPGIDAIQISNDPNCEPSIEIYKKLHKEMENKIVVVDIMSIDEIKRNLEFLKQQNAIIWYYAKDLEEAKEAVSLIRQELPVVL